MQGKTLVCLSAFFCVLLFGCDKKPPEEAATPIVERTEGPLILAVMPELPPYAYVDANSGALCGIDIEIVKAAAARLRKPLEIRQMPFDELFQAVRDHRADFAAGALTITKGRSYDVDFSISYAEEGSAFLYHVGDPMPTMVRAEGLRVGAVESMTHDFYLTRHGIDPFRYATVEQACADLVAGKIDTIFYDRPALVEMAKASGGKLGVTPLETREHYGIAVRKDRYDYLEAVNAVIRERRSK